MKKKKILAMLMALTLTIQQASVISFAEETSNNDTDKNSISETYWSDLWTGQTTDEILERIEKNNLDLTKFFDADLTKGITKDDLVKWKNEGKDINDVILERGRQYSSRINDNSNTESTWTDENGITHVNVKTHNSAITSDPNNFYYITDCETPKSFSNAIVDSPNKFRNPKIDISKVKYPVKLNSWDITLGYDEAVCLSFNGGARRNNGMHFVQGNITDLLNNISFNKNNTSNYPIDSYLRGAIYAYERLMNIKYGNTPYSFVHSDGTPATNLYYILDGKNVYDSNLNELEKTLQNLRGINGEDVIKSYDRDAYRMMLQILVWRISQGDYQNWDLQTEMDIAANIFGQMTGYNEQVLKDITNIYNYFLHCAGEAATNQYNNLYTSIAIQYYAVQGTNSENYQDFVTWDVVKPNVPSCTITINKIGNEIKTSVADNSGLKLPFAQFGIYSNKDCTNKIASFTTDFNGQATLNLVEGTYYLKEENAPKGAIINNNIIPITILDNTGNTYNSYIDNNLFYNKLIMVKYDNKTKEIIKNPGVFLLQEKVGNNYMTVAQLSFTDVDMNIGNTKIPAYSYYLSPYANQIYHDGNGNIMSNIQHDGFYYTTVNDGNFRVIEQSAPSGYENTSATLTISMDLTNQGKVLLYNKFSTGMKDNPKNYTSTLNVKKYDTMSGEELKNVAFKLQERVNNTWYDCGNLIYNDTIGYFTTNIATTYVFHKDNGTTYTTSQSNYPILSTKYNSGSFRIVETKLENEHYKITAIKTFSVPQKDNYVADMTVYNSHNNNSGINNTGENLTVYVNKYDSITKEPITENQQTITLELFEYNKTKKDYLSIGTLSYDEKLNRYSLNSTTLYTPHTLNGELNTTLSIGENIIPGNIYYTSANEGKFKIVETIAPKNYILGNIKDDGTVEKFEKEFNIENTTSIDFTSIDTGVIDTPVNIKANVSKYDTTTNEKINTTNAEFTVYEKIGEQYYESGKLVYNKDTKQYETKGMTLRLCNSKGVVVFEKKVDGLYYTSANKGFYKIVETKAPTNYELNEFSKEFNIINDSVNNIIDFTNTLSAAKDTGIKGSVEVKKFDINTNDIVTTNDAEFTVYEKIDTDYIEIGKLNFDKNTKSYVSSGDYTYHNLDKKAVNTVNGLIYTNENKGEFKIVETKAPTNYKLNKYEKTFNITKTKNVKYTDLTNGAKDTGIKGSVKLLKTDKNTNKVLTGATFKLKEWSTVTNSWKTIDTLTDNKDGIYTTNKLVYTTSNLGKFIVTEIKAPDGYINENYTSEVLILDTDEKMFDLTSNEKKVTNTPIQVGISKKSLTNNKDIKNAELIVKDNNGTQIDKWISDGTEHIISGIKPGTYTLTEISSPNGYLISRTITFVVKETTEIQKVIMYDDIVRGKVHLTKADKNTNKKLSDAIYELRDSKDNLIDTLTTDKNGNADSKEISFGIYDTDGTYKGSKEYYLTEVKAPEGYQLDNSKIPVTFDYKDDTTPIVITNINVKDLPLIPLNIEISKKSLTTTKELVGATLEVISENGTVIDKWISNGKTHTIRNVKAGKYILIEITAPNGYIRTSKVEFTVDGEHEITKVEMFDDIVKGKLILNKIDSDTQKKLADATFELLDSNGKVIDTLVTNNEGYAESKEIYFGNYAENGEYLGSKEYTLVEKKAPNGYNLKNDKEKITFDYVNDTTPIVTKNALEENVPIKVSISKKSFTTEKDIIGAELIVTDNNGNEVDKWVSDGTEHIISGIKPGTYTLTENHTPNGYIKSSKITFTVKEDTEIQKVVMYDDEVKGKVILNKSDAETNKKLANTKFELKDINGNIIDTLITDKNGYAESKEIYFGNYSENGEYIGSKEYTLEEIKATNGYLLDNTKINIIFEYKNDITPIVFKKIIKTNKPLKASISKKSITDNKNIIGASLEVRDENDKIVDSWVSNETDHIISNIKPGKYTLTEIIAPNGYIKSATIPFTIDGTKEITKIEMFDDIVKGKVELTKTDKKTKKILKNAIYELKENGKTIETLTTDESGKAISKEIYFGNYDENGKYLGSKEYTLVEIKAPNGYLLDSTPLKVNFEYKDDTTKVITTKINATDISENAIISKKSITDGKDIIGAELIVIDENGNEIDKWVSDGTEHIIKAIKTGTYYLIENTAPNGYIKTSKVTFTIDGTKENTKVEMFDDEVKGKLIIDKTDSDTKQKLANAEFTLRDSEGKVIETIITDTNGHAESKEIYFGNYAKNGEYLGSKEYILTETKAPEGYKLDKKSEKITFNYVNDETSIVTTTITEENVPIKVSISKKSITTEKDIIGAELIVTDNNGNEVDKWVSDGTEHIISGIKPGTYTLTENHTPNGYIKSSKITFTVKEDTEIQKVVMYDDEVKGKVILNKSDTETNEKLANAIYELKDTDGNVIDTLITDNNGHAESKELSFGIYDKNGKYLGSKEYTLVEIKAPDGYNLNNEVNTFKFSYINDTTTIVTTTLNVTDQPIKVGISKKSITDGKDIIGAELIVTDNNGNEVDKWVSDGTEHIISAIKPGTYTLTEIKAPDGYIISSKVDFTVTETTEIQKVVMFDEVVKGKVIINKIDSDTKENLSDVTFELKDTDGNVIDTLITDNNGYAESKEIPFGIYDENGKYLGSKEYILTELKEKDGYNLNKDINTFKFEYVNDTTPVVTNTFSKENTPIKVGISKKSITDGKDIIGAELIVTDNNGNEVDKWVSDGTEHIISAIKPGTYTLTEIKAPDGYIISSKVDFTVTETTEIQKVVMFDEVVKGKIIINKVDKETDNVLKNATFELKDINGNVIDTLITDNNGYAESKEIPFGIYDENGKYLGSKKYTLVEVKAPNGYKLDSTPINVMFEQKDDTTKVVEVKIIVKNEKIKEAIKEGKSNVTTINPVTKTEINHTIKTPKTGDINNISKIIVLAIISALTLIIFGKRKYKEN